VYRSPLLDKLPRDTPGVYSLTGGRQVGKTTVLKQYMSELLASGVLPGSVAYVPGELFDDHHAFVAFAMEYLGTASTDVGVRVLIVDEVTYIREWDRGVKFLADAGLLRNCALLLTGSDTVLIRDARTRFPGRRGRADRVDFHLFPLSFAECVALRRGCSTEELQAMAANAEDIDVGDVEAEFTRYLAHGGCLTAVNDIEANGAIAPATFATYCDWIRGDVLKRGKREHFLRDILSAVVRSTGSQVTWNALSKDMSIDHPATVSEYVELLARMDALIVQAALREDRLAGAPKKARKIHFADVFISHAVRAMLSGAANPYEDTVRPLFQSPESLGRLVESCAVSHLHRLYPTYYIKSKGEVDIAYVRDGRFWPVEIKWTRQLRPGDLKQAAKYANSTIWAPAGTPSRVHDLPCEPLVLALLRLGPSPCFLRG